MSRKQNLAQQNRRRKKRGLKARRGQLMPEMLAPAIKKCKGDPVITSVVINPHQTDS